MDPATVAAFGLAAAAVVATGVAVTQHFRVVYLETLFAATYQLAGTLTQDPDVFPISEHEFESAVELLLNVTGNPDSPDAASLLNMRYGKEGYPEVLARAHPMRPPIPNALP